MGALTALQRSPGALARNPVLVIPVLVIGLFQFPQLLLQSTDPILASLLSFGISGLFVFVVPFFQGGIIGMADEALGGRTQLGTFVSEGKSHYVSILVVYLLLLVMYFVVGGFLFFGAILGGAFVLRGDVGFSPALGVVGLVFVVLLLLFLLFVFLVQFYGQAIVLDGEGAVSSVKRSYGLVRRNLLSTFGYSIIGAVVGGISGLGIGALSMLVSPGPTPLVDLPQLSLPSIAVVALVTIIVASIVGSFLAVFSVAFYRDISG